MSKIRAVALGLTVAAVTAIGSARAQTDDAALVTKGEYLAKAADCMPCHTALNGGQPFAGGLALNTPFGAIYSRNITSDTGTGIGTWSYADFTRAVRDGIGKQGEYLYPAMPFTSYTKISDDDMKALWAYIRRLPPADRANTPNALPFPFNVRYSLLGWRELFFSDQRFKPEPAKSASWNRGAYIVEALGHCGECHTPRNIFGATEAGHAFQGAKIDTWFAPNLATDALKRLDGWTQSSLVKYLKTGTSPRTTSFGPMYEVVHDSLGFMTDDDLNAVAAYLLDRPAPSGKRAPQAISPMTRTAHDHGADAYLANCVACHQSGGAGQTGAVPPLAGNPAVQAAEPFDVISVVLSGLIAQGKYGSMPSFAAALGDQTVADLVNYVRTSWGNSAAPNATPEMVSAVRAAVVTTAAASDSARDLQCPQVGGGPTQTNNIDPATNTELTNLMQGGGAFNVAKLVGAFQNANQNAGLADTVNGLVAAFCPLVAKTSQDLAAKRALITRFSSAVATYVASQALPAPTPDLGIVWSSPAGKTLVARLPSGYKPFACPADDAAKLPAGISTAVQPMLAGLGPRVPAAQTMQIVMQSQAAAPKAAPADLANALILGFCRNLNTNSTLTPAEKSAALTLFGENVIQSLQDIIETQRVKQTAAKK